jgi:hypothetical protein
MGKCNQVFKIVAPYSAMLLLSTDNAQQIFGGTM